uniref:SH2 domain-containing protein n=1 Tax=Salarias fasciatus TaxID=181472 RepID=A0A672GXV6_SALFA
MGMILEDVDFLEHSQNESGSRSNMLWSLVQSFFNYFFFCSRGTGSPMNANRPASPEGSQVNIMGIHTVPGSPNTLHRTVATNTPPSSALQRRLGQASPSLARHPPSGGVPSSPVIGRSSKMALAGVPPSPLESAAEARPTCPAHCRTSPSPYTVRIRRTRPAFGLAGGNLSVSVPTDGYPDIKMNVKFVQDTSRFWYKPDISREQAINLLKDREPGTFIIRDSHSFRGTYGLAMKVAQHSPRQANSLGDMTNELVRHFLIETSAKGVRLKGCPNEPYFGCLSALVYQHSMTPLALPCKLMIPTKGRPRPPASQAGTCNVLYISSVDMESLTGPQAVAKAISQTLASNPLPAATTVHFRVSAQGITLTDSQRKRFSSIKSSCRYFIDLLICRRRRRIFPLRLYGFVARKQGSTTDNVSHLFAELDPDQPASAIPLLLLFYSERTKKWREKKKRKKKVFFFFSIFRKKVEP